MGVKKRTERMRHVLKDATFHGVTSLGMTTVEMWLAYILDNGPEPPGPPSRHIVRAPEPSSEQGFCRVPSLGEVRDKLKEVDEAESTHSKVIELTNALRLIEDYLSQWR